MPILDVGISDLFVPDTKCTLMFNKDSFPTFDLVNPESKTGLRQTFNWNYFTFQEDLETPDSKPIKLDNLNNCDKKKDSGVESGEISDSSESSLKDYFIKSYCLILTTGLSETKSFELDDGIENFNFKTRKDDG